MTNLKIFIHSYDTLLEKAISKLDNDELNCLTCYTVEKKIQKNITNKIERINEWELPWNDYSYRIEKYYDYGIFPHLFKNESIIDGTSHIGLLQYDVLFNENSVKNIKSKFDENPNTIFYNSIRSVNDLWLTEIEFRNICSFLSERINVKIDSDFIIRNGWISETFSITNTEVFRKFGEFVFNNKEDIENILKKNMWGIMNRVSHRMCGIIERMWGFYLMSIGHELVKMDIEHDHNSYVHQHLTEI